jgi:hypothetical protein
MVTPTDQARTGGFGVQLGKMFLGQSVDHVVVVHDSTMNV